MKNSEKVRLASENLLGLKVVSLQVWEVVSQTALIKEVLCELHNGELSTGASHLYHPLMSPWGFCMFLDGYSISNSHQLGQESEVNMMHVLTGRSLSPGDGGAGCRKVCWGFRCVCTSRPYAAGRSCPASRARYTSCS